MDRLVLVKTKDNEYILAEYSLIHFKVEEGKVIELIPLYNRLEHFHDLESVSKSLKFIVGAENEKQK